MANQAVRAKNKKSVNLPGGQTATRSGSIVVDTSGGAVAAALASGDLELVPDPPAAVNEPPRDHFVTRAELEAALAGGSAFAHLTEVGTTLTYDGDVHVTGDLTVDGSAPGGSAFAHLVEDIGNSFEGSDWPLLVGTEAARESWWNGDGSGIIGYYAAGSFAVQSAVGTDVGWSGGSLTLNKGGERVTVLPDHAGGAVIQITKSGGGFQLTSAGGTKTVRLNAAANALEVV